MAEGTASTSSNGDTNGNPQVITSHSLAESTMSTLLGFQKKILSEIVNPDSSDLVLLARGLGLRKIICSLMQIYDSPHSLILLVNANADEEGGIGEELGIMGVVKPGLRIVGHEMPKKDRYVWFTVGLRRRLIEGAVASYRQVLYKKGGLISITSRILVVDMLQSDIPTDMITGILVLHAEKYVHHLQSTFSLTNASIE